MARKDNGKLGAAGRGGTGRGGKGLAARLVPGSVVLTAANALGLFDDKKEDEGKKPNKKRGGGMVKVAGYKAGGSIKGGKKSIDGIARKGKTKARHR